MPRRFYLATAFVSLLLVLFIGGGTPGRDATPATAAEPGLMGDVNCSGAVDAVDSLQILRLVAGIGSSAGCVDTAGDNDCSGAVNSVDSLRILRFVASLSVSVPDGCTPLGGALGPPPTTEQLIEAAREDGKITEEQALTYEVFSVFGDSRLPAEFRGTDPADDDGSTMIALAQQYGGLSAEAKAMVDPYLLPPSAPGSWMELRYPEAPSVEQAGACPPACSTILWGHKATQNGKVKVWWRRLAPEDEVKAQLVADALDNDIWEPMMALMGREPLSDAAVAANGGDGLLDMYLVPDIEHLGEMIPYNRTNSPAEIFNPCKKSPAYIILNRTDKDLAVTAAHELFHAVQFTFDGKDTCNQLHWLHESTSTWAEDFIYPDLNVEHRRRYWFEFASFPLNESDDNIGNYGRYIFFLFVTRNHGADVMRQIWTNTETYPGIEAVDKALPGGLKDVWPEFALAHWNQEPVDVLKQLDGIPHKAEPRGLLSDYNTGVTEIKLEGDAEKEFEPRFLAEVKPVTTDYYHFKVADAAVDLVEFSNPFFKNRNEFTNVQALVKISGRDWEIEDWTEKEGAAFCLALESQRLEEMVLLFSNSHLDLSMYPSPSKPLARATDSCGWVGNAKSTTNFTNSGGTIWTVTMEATDLVFAPVEGGDGGAAGPQRFELASGTVKATYSGIYFPSSEGGNCTVEGTKTVDAAPGDGYLEIEVTPEQNLAYTGHGTTGFTVPIIIHCPDHDTPSQNNSLSWLATGGTLTSTDTDRIEGSRTSQTSPTIESTYEWQFTRGKPPGQPNVR